MNFLSDLSEFARSKNKLKNIRDIVYKDPAKNVDCSQYEVDNWILSKFIVENLYPIVGIHPFPVNELLLMTSAVCYFKSSHIFDWGTNVGKSARIFYETSKYFRINSEIHSIDLPEDIDHIEHPHAEIGRLVKGISEVKLHFGDGLDASLGICKSAGKVRKPLFLLDGDHEYESVYRELKGIINAIDDPVILVHDTFYQSKESGYNVGPHNAVEKIMSENEKEFEVIATNTGLPGMTLIYRKNDHHDNS